LPRADVPPDAPAPGDRPRDRGGAVGPLQLPRAHVRGAGRPGRGPPQRPGEAVLRGPGLVRAVLGRGAPGRPLQTPLRRAAPPTPADRRAHAPPPPRLRRAGPVGEGPGAAARASGRRARLRPVNGLAGSQTRPPGAPARSIAQSISAGERSATWGPA